jgi:hypothetical protein
VGGRGFEPLTPSASRKCSPPELTARALVRSDLHFRPSTLGSPPSTTLAQRRSGEGLGACDGEGQGSSGRRGTDR